MARRRLLYAAAQNGQNAAIMSAVLRLPASFRATVSGIGVRLRDGILPPACLSCDRTTDKQGQLCAQCWSQMRFIEKPYCAVLGTPFSYDLGEGALSADAIANTPPFDTSRSVALYDDTARQLVHGLKFADRTDLAPWMSRFILRISEGRITKNSIIVPVPLHRRRLFIRRYNQSAELARHLAKLTSAHYRPDLLLRSRATLQQVGLGAKERENNVRGAFRIPKGFGIHIKGRHLVLIDDVYTTGATIRACARVLKRAGAVRIDCLTFARVASGDLQTHI